MDTVGIAAQKRTEGLTADQVRAQGNIPCECYGAGKQNESIQIEYQTFRKAYNIAGGSTVIDLDVDGTLHKCLIHDLQFDPVYGTVTHVDFIYIDMNKPVVTHVPIVLTGASPAVKELGGTLTHTLHELEVKCLPADIPHEFMVDVSGIEDFNTSIHVSDIAIPHGVEILTDSALTVASVAAPRAMEEEPDTDTADAEAEAIAALAGEDAEEGGSEE